MFLLVSCGNIGVPERDSNMGVWKSKKPESGKGTGIETGTGTRNRNGNKKRNLYKNRDNIYHNLC